MSGEARPPISDDLAARIAAALNPLGGQFAVAARRVGAARRAVPVRAAGTPTSEESPPALASAVELRADLPLPAATLAHLPVVIELLRRVDLGQYALDERISVSEGGATDGAMTADGANPTIGDLCARAISACDTAAADALLDLVGMGEVRETLHRLNLDQTRLARHFAETADEPVWRVNLTSARDMLTLLGLARGNALPGAAALREWLAGQRRFAELAAALPAGAEVAHLPALGTERAHDAGVLSGPGGACAYCVLLAGATESSAARAAIIAVVRLLWDAWCAG